MSGSSVSVAETVGQIIADQMKRPREEVTLESDLSTLGIESLDLLEIIYEIETKFSIFVPYNANESERGELTTVGDVVRVVEAATNGR